MAVTIEMRIYMYDRNSKQFNKVLLVTGLILKFEGYSHFFINLVRKFLMQAVSN